MTDFILLGLLVLTFLIGLTMYRNSDIAPMIMINQLSKKERIKIVYCLTCMFTPFIVITIIILIRDIKH